MNPQDPQKILLSGTSTLSLHNRFTGLLNHQQADVMDLTTKVNAQNSASIKNRRLALEMANKPSVLAALRNTSVRHTSLDKNHLMIFYYRLNNTCDSCCLQNINNQHCKVSVKTRLGQPIGRGGMCAFQRKIGGGGDSGGLIKGFYTRRGVIRLHGAAASPLGLQQGWGQIKRGGCVKRAGPTRIRGGGANKRTGDRFQATSRGINSPVCTGSSQLTPVSGACSGNSWARFKSDPVPSREELDKQLDEYMSTSKSHLDAELDAYMAQVDLEEIM
ncbi:chromatin target of PRMT1b isoform X1 [Paramisgurnus dabryanus]|uniref:chromatin target of PRMT1b isoform X1 n=1 Tax=Paramisgurnus dabryanus TaxID=90735 RepID=UPI0031F3BB06